MEAFLQTLTGIEAVMEEIVTTPVEVHGGWWCEHVEIFSPLKYKEKNWTVLELIGLWVFFHNSTEMGTGNRKIALLLGQDMPFEVIALFCFTGSLSLKSMKGVYGHFHCCIENVVLL